MQLDECNKGFVLKVRDEITNPLESRLIIKCLEFELLVRYFVKL